MAKRTANEWTATPHNACRRGLRGAIQRLPNHKKYTLNTSKQSNYTQMIHNTQ